MFQFRFGFFAVRHMNNGHSFNRITQKYSCEVTRNKFRKLEISLDTKKISQLKLKFMNVYSRHEYKLWSPAKYNNNNNWWKISTCHNEKISPPSSLSLLLHTHTHTARSTAQCRRPIKSSPPQTRWTHLCRRKILHEMSEWALVVCDAMSTQRSRKYFKCHYWRIES